MRQKQSHVFAGRRSEGREECERESEKGETHREKGVRTVDERGRQTQTYAYRAKQTAVFLLNVLVPEISLT